MKREKTPMRNSWWVLGHPTRAMEVYLSLVMMSLGVFYALPGDTMGVYPQYKFLRVWISYFPGDETRFGLLVAGVGLVRLMAIIVNGNWYPTPAFRALGCVVGSFLWTTFTMSIVKVDPTPPFIAFTVFATAFECISMSRISVDAFMMDTFGLRRRATKRVRQRDRRNESERARVH